MMIRTLTAIFLSLCISETLPGEEKLSFEEPKISQVQVIGTHNSYHIQPHPSLERLIRLTNNEFGDALEYSHRPLREQFSRLGIRQIELDLFADPEGGHYSSPKGVGMAKSSNYPDVPDFDPENKLDRPGIKVMHIPDFDYLTTVHTFKEALLDIQNWSDKNPNHYPIFILLEVKESAIGPLFTKPIKFNEDHLLEIEKEILSVMEPDDMITPQQLQGHFPNLREAILKRGWPSIASSRGRVVFCLDNTNHIRDMYLENDPNLKNRIIFPSVSEDHNAAAFFKINNPFSGFEQIQKLVRQGFIIRTRADTPTKQARLNDHSQKDKALASGAQLISTDYPEPNPSFGPYRVAFPGQIVVQTNPVNGQKAYNGIDLESVTHDVERPIQLLARMAMQFHTQRRLAEASSYYEKILELEPSKNLSEEELMIVKNCAPDLFLNDREFFSLKDVVVIMHPSKPWIAYHLMWGDDIDFPADNDPVDHEVIWVQYNQQSHIPEKLFTYFHGSILTTKIHDSSRPLVGIEWGKHGSLPISKKLKPIHNTKSLFKNWERLHKSGIRHPNHPFAKLWPKSFPFAFEDYQNFESKLSLDEFIHHQGHIRKGRWGNAIIDQECLPYNFSAKIEWPH